jgi:hypothetical protein
MRSGGHFQSGMKPLPPNSFPWYPGFDSVGEEHQMISALELTVADS